MLYQNDGVGKDHLQGLKEASATKPAWSSGSSYETSEPTVDSQMAALLGGDADILLIAATPKFAAQAIRKSADLGFTGVRYLTSVAQSIVSVLKPAGLEKSKGLITGAISSIPTTPVGRTKPVQGWKAFTDKYMTPATSPILTPLTPIAPRA